MNKYIQLGFSIVASLCGIAFVTALIVSPEFLGMAVAVSFAVPPVAWVTYRLYTLFTGGES